MSDVSDVSDTSDAGEHLVVSEVFGPTLQGEGPSLGRRAGFVRLGRCNLACAHCYIAAGSWHSAANDLTTDECLRITDEIIAVNPAPMFILSGGEPLLRKDL